MSICIKPVCWPKSDALRLPLRVAAGTTPVARRIGTLAGVPQADARSLKDHPRTARLVGQVTAADLSREGIEKALKEFGL